MSLSTVRDLEACGETIPKRWRMKAVQCHLCWHWVMPPGTNPLVYFSYTFRHSRTCDLWPLQQGWILMVDKQSLGEGLEEGSVTSLRIDSVSGEYKVHGPFFTWMCSVHWETTLRIVERFRWRLASNRTAKALQVIWPHHSSIADDQASFISSHWRKWVHVIGSPGFSNAASKLCFLHKSTSLCGIVSVTPHNHWGRNCLVSSVLISFCWVPCREAETQLNSLEKKGYLNREV